MVLLMTAFLSVHAEQSRQSIHAVQNQQSSHKTPLHKSNQKIQATSTKHKIAKLNKNTTVHKKSTSRSKIAQTKKTKNVVHKETNAKIKQQLTQVIHTNKKPQLKTPIHKTSVNQHAHHKKKVIPQKRSTFARTNVVPLEELVDFDNYPTAVKELIMEAKILSKQNLTYLFGSANPKNKGMDCSGTINYLLKQQNISSPRQTHEIYMWLEKEGELHKVRRLFFVKDKLENLKPGDLLFWKDTYKVNRTPPITHVMLYLGKNKNNQHLMFGSSNGGVYNKKSMYGVSVFEFNYPKNDTGKFVAYGCIPGVSCDSQWG